MKFFTRLAISFYVLIISVLSGAVILFATDVITLNDVSYYLRIVHNDPTVNMAVTITSCGLIIFSFILARIISGNQQKERTIAFDNPSGRVSVSLVAVEDLVKRMLYKNPEVKDVKPTIVAGKKGVSIEAKLVLRADVNIPEMTSKLQDTIKNKIQEILGLDETVTVRLHIIKMISDQSKSKGPRQDKDQESETAVPFQGYRS
ncbi:MAG: alkaline shock response membrane anchor protein AmaP [Candidatus Omnitrophota bacterium]